MTKSFYCLTFIQMTSTRERESRSVNSINQRMLSGLLTITMLHERYHQRLYHYRHVNCTTLYMCGESHGSCQMNMLCYSCLNYTHDAADDGIEFRAHYHTIFLQVQGIGLHLLLLYTHRCMCMLNVRHHCLLIGDGLDSKSF